MVSIQIRLWLSSVVPWLIIVFCSVGVVVVQNMGLKSVQNQLSEEDYEKISQDEAIQLNFLVRSPSVGFDNIIADWVYLGFIQYFGDTPARNQTGHELLPKYYQLLVDKDPLFTDALFRLDVATSLFAGKPQVSADLLGEALAKMPRKFITKIQPYYLWRAKGNNELIFLGDIDAAKESYRQSIEWAKAYDDEESQKIVRISENSLRILAENPDSKEARIGAWVGVLANRPDEKTVKRVIEEIEKLGGKVTMQADGRITVSLPR
jgi:tetratricopeptide (TPR) repeat protein